MAIEVGVRQLKGHLSDLIGRVENGETVTVTRHGKPVAQMIPAAVPPHLAKLIAAGKLRPGVGTPRLPRPVKLRGKGKSAVDYVIEGRR
ncbi:MAG: hypothetical protein QOJ38_319 [Solirubrobacterales bacterium]|jgi:prevent-host-death family protein|nr:hypothetical protein [Solirubrobacterales bacterium]